MRSEEIPDDESDDCYGDDNRDKVAGNDIDHPAIGGFDPELLEPAGQSVKEPYPSNLGCSNLNVRSY